MGELERRIAQDLKESIKNKQQVRIDTLRMLSAAMHNLCIEKRQDSLNDEDVLQVIAKQVKQHRDSIESFKKGGREDLVKKETKELEILESYLPPGLDEGEIEEIVKNIIADTGASSKSDFGRVMKLAMQEMKGRADGKTVNSIVQKLLPK